MDRQAILDELDQARRSFRSLVTTASVEDLRRPSSGTRWTNRELLFHMLFGYLLMPALLLLARVFGHLPPRVSRPFARLLNAGTVPFNFVNYAGSWIGGRLLRPVTMVRTFDRVTTRLGQRLLRESGGSLARGMHYPARWDPFFKDFMTVADLYHYPTQHFDFHREQLSL
jgi:hypothetical protein